MTQKIVYPFGWLAGKEGELSEVIEFLAIEMLGHRSNLQERAERTGDEAQRAALSDQAELLERYAVILNVVYLQLHPERWTPKTLGGLLELAAKHNITLPEWMKELTPHEPK